MKLPYEPQKPSPRPGNAEDWLKLWDEEREMVVPTSDGKTITIQLLDLKKLDHSLYERNKPDAWARSALHDFDFYIVLSEYKVFKNVDKRTLIFPPRRGVNHSFWLVPRK